jgi:hypothetical protein
MADPTCGYVILTCMDFRFVEPLRRFLAVERIEGDADLLAWPGGAACLALDEERERAVAALALARTLHGCDRAVLVVHEDCRRLGGSAAHAGPQAEAATLANYLRRASGEVRARIPGLDPRSIVLRASGEVVEVT